MANRDPHSYAKGAYSVAYKALAAVDELKGMINSKSGFGDWIDRAMREFNTSVSMLRSSLRATERDVQRLYDEGGNFRNRIAELERRQELIDRYWQGRADRTAYAVDSTDAILSLVEEGFVKPFSAMTVDELCDAWKAYTVRIKELEGKRDVTPAIKIVALKEMRDEILSFIEAA